MPETVLMTLTGGKVMQGRARINNIVALEPAQNLKTICGEGIYSKKREGCSRLVWTQSKGSDRA
jgi:hypothetical protein